MTNDVFSLTSAINHTRIVPFRTTGAGLPLFCFPGAGGDADIFEHMVPALPEGQPVYAIDMESLCDIKGDFSIEQLAPFYLDVIREFKKPAPIIFADIPLGVFWRTR